MSLFESIGQDVRYSVRGMRSRPGFALIACLSLGLGIGATTAIFSVIYSLALRSLPLPHPERLVEVTRGGEWNLHTYAEWTLFRDRQDVLSNVLAYNYFDTTFEIASQSNSQEISGLYVSGDYFSTLGVPAMAGRVLQASDDQPGSPPVCVLGYGLSRRLFGQPAHALGRTIQIDGNQFQAVGVAPGSFFGLDVDEKPEIFMPLEAERTYKDYPPIYGKQTPSLDSAATILRFAGRLKPEGSVSQANAGLKILSAGIDGVLREASNSRGERSPASTNLVARPIPNGMSTAWLQNIDVVLLLMAMAGVALFIACANLGNLLLARAAKRRGEIAVRLALGATRGRLVRQFLTESLALAVIGTATGLIIARWCTRMLVWALSFPGAPISLDLSWDAKLGLFVVSITVASALLFGLAPAIGATDVSLYAAMNSGPASARRRNRATNAVLVVAQVALSVTLFANAVLLARTLEALLAQNPGYDPKGVLAVQASWQGARADAEREAMAGNGLLTVFRSVPGVTSASWSRSFNMTTLPRLTVMGPDGAEKRIGSYLVFVSSEFLATRHTAMLAGRDFNDADGGSSLPVAILSQTLARSLFGDVNPVGLSFRENDSNANGQGFTVEVVGVAGDIQYRRPSDGNLPILYRPVSQCGNSCSGIGSYEIRSAGPLAETTKRLENAAANFDGHIALKCEPLVNEAGRLVHRNRAMAIIAATFSLFVAFLAMVGVYALTSYSASERTREIGIRMTLGAQRAEVFRILLFEMMGQVCIGTALGWGVAVLSSRMIAGIIWGVKATDPLSFGFAMCAMLTITVIAACLPAQRAMRVDPAASLRFE
jgi:putative ABC transport system permease protein